MELRPNVKQGHAQNSVFMYIFFNFISIFLIFLKTVRLGNYANLDILQSYNKKMYPGKGNHHQGFAFLRFRFFTLLKLTERSANKIVVMLQSCLNYNFFFNSLLIKKL